VPAGPKAALGGLDVLRGCAAGAVMLHHHGDYYDVLYPGRTPLSFDLGPGHFGVELFFIISGFRDPDDDRAGKTPSTISPSRASHG